LWLVVGEKTTNNILICFKKKLGFLLK